MKAKDIMIPLQDSLIPENTLKEAVNKLKKAGAGEGRVGLKALPVLDRLGGLAGILSMGDILKAVLPSYMSMMDLGDFTWDGMMESLARKVAGRTAESLMTKKVVTVREDAPLMECVDHMVKKDVKKLIVLDRNGAVSGILYETDVFFEITKSLLGEQS